MPKQLSKYSPEDKRDMRKVSREANSRKRKWWNENKTLIKAVNNKTLLAGVEDPKLQLTIEEALKVSKERKERINASKKKWWHSEKGKAYQAKLKIKLNAEKAFMEQIEELHKSLTDTPTELMSPEDDDQEGVMGFQEWSELQHALAIEQWNLENKKR